MRYFPVLGLAGAIPLEPCRGDSNGIESECLGTSPNLSKTLCEPLCVFSDFPEMHYIAVWRSRFGCKFFKVELVNLALKK